METLIGAGLGLDHDKLQFDRTTDEWIVAGSALRNAVAERLDAAGAHVEQIGSSAVLGLLSKPIVDLAVGVSGDREFARVVDTLVTAGWVYRGDAGDDGGHVFVLEARPWHRVAHLHVVEHGGAQWVNYRRFRDLLRRSSEARAQYEAVKLRLAEAYGGDRTAYQQGKSAVVTALLQQASAVERHP